MEKTYPLNLQLPKANGTISPSRLLDIETLIRLNPIWTVRSITSSDNHFTAQLENYAEGGEFTIAGQIEPSSETELQISFSTGDYANLCIQAEGGSLHASVHYANPDFVEDSDQERHTVLWLRAIQEYLRLYLKRTPYTLFFRYVMNRVILQMTPSQRKISLMLIRFTMIEVLIIILIVIGYVIFVL